MWRRWKGRMMGAAGDEVTTTAQLTNYEVIQQQHVKTKQTAANIQIKDRFDPFFSETEATSGGRLIPEFATKHKLMGGN